ncbi:hypothetical protein MMC25_007323 [Agyrium rufum]|nr:hypothetical protein [Agyrium rufum]
MHLRTWIDGPYGTPVDVSEYGTVVLLATGMGIAAQLPLLKAVVDECHNGTAKARRIVLVWQLDRSQNLIIDWMNQILVRDQGAYILQVKLYVEKEFKNEETKYGDIEEYGEHARISKLYGQVDLWKMLRQEIEEKRGRMLITSEYQHL